MAPKTIVLVTGGFDPLHSGHIKYLESAGEDNYLVVGLNSDDWLARKKGKPFMPFEERASVLAALRCVDNVISFDDSDGTANDAIAHLLDDGAVTVHYVNGGDRDQQETPEWTRYSHNPKVTFQWGVGGSDKKNSSGWILNEWDAQKAAERPWGSWRVYSDKQTIKVKELIIEPFKSLSDQRHEFRSEHWYVLSGKIYMETQDATKKDGVVLLPNDRYIINRNVWHKATNIDSEPAHVLEVQYGTRCVEEDIERRNT